jgi:hypothetical protein
VRRPDALTRAFRSSCSQCGSGQLEWLLLDEARVAGVSVDEAVSMLGSVESVWRCRSCGECGFFGPTEVW